MRNWFSIKSGFRTSVTAKHSQVRFLCDSERVRTVAPKMHSSKPWTPFYAILRRALSSSSHISLNSISRTRCSTILSPSDRSNVEPSGTLSGTRRNFLENFRFNGKGLCSLSTDQVSVKCWKCGAAAHTAAFLFCDSCRSIQPVDHSVDYFQIFGWERKFEIDGDLEGKYKDWQKKLHPDLVHSKSEEEREYAAEQSARVIDAYHTLRSPLSRAKYILKLENVLVDEEETISEPELLAEIMEIREAVEEATTSQDLKHIQTQMQEKLNQWAQTFANAFQSRRFDEAITSIRRMTYYERVNEEIMKKL